MMTDQPNNVVANVVALSEGFVLQLANGRTVGYPNITALSKALPRELRKRAPKVKESVTSDAGPQWFNLAKLCDAAELGAITREDFERGIKQACPDIYRANEAQPAIGAALRALSQKPQDSPRGETAPTVNKDAKRERPAVMPWRCGACKRASDCVFDTGDEMNLRPGIEEPCEICQRCLDDECWEEQQALGTVEPEIMLREAVEDDDELDGAPRRARILNEQGQQIGELLTQE